ncbi:MAG TPA: prepilin-type N-terminal cleavage/methylation domain-containing protein [Egibacteraceae bacterium]|nr:prepilin-type N-terminal cleavage/methylation domain-containing protein [Egibacteraceae bacterium]
MGDNTRPPPGSEAGFSLVELLVAISVFGVFLVGMVGVFISAARSIGDQRLRAAATRVASDRLETLRSLPYDQLGAEAGSRTTTTPDGRAFTVDTAVANIDAATGAPSAGGRVQQITVTVRWTSGGAARNVSYTTGVAADPRSSFVPQAIGVITMFPSPSTTDASGRPLEDIEVTVPLEDFPLSTLVNLSWSNADGTAGAKTLTTTSGVNWRGTIAKDQVRAAMGADGRGEMQFTVSAGGLAARYTLALQRVVATPPAITGATIDRNPVTVAKPATGKTCDAANQCLNTTDVVFAVTTTGLDPAQDSVILQYQLHDTTFQEVPLTPVSGVTGQWQLTLRQKTTKFLADTGRAFRFTAIRSGDGATAGTTVLRDVVSV